MFIPQESIEFSLRMKDKVFSDELKSMDTDEFKALASEIETALNQVIIH